MTLLVIERIVIGLLAGIFLAVCGLLWIAVHVRRHLEALKDKPTGRHGPVK